MRITIIGGGNGAFATAADLSAKGHEVTVAAAGSHYHNLTDLAERRRITATGPGFQGEYEIARVTSDLNEGLDGCDLVMPIAPSFAHEEMAESLAPYVRDDQKILLSPGGTGGALVFARVFRKRNVAKNAMIGEFHTLPYVARKEDSGSVRINLTVKKLYCACFPAKRNDEMQEIAEELYDGVDMVSDVLETGLNNGNIVIHPAPVVLNAGKIEYYGKHYHYKEGITPSVGKVIQAVDDERKKVCRMFGYREIDVKQRLYEQGDCALTDNVYDTVQSSEGILLPLEGPNDLDNRYLVEDTSISLVVVLGLASVAGLKLPTMEAVLQLANVMKSSNFMETGRTLGKMGIDHMDVDEIKRYLLEGRL